MSIISVYRRSSRNLDANGFEVSMVHIRQNARCDDQYNSRTKKRLPAGLRLVRRAQFAQFLLLCPELRLDLLQ